MGETKTFQANMSELDAMKEYLLEQADVYFTDKKFRLRLEISLEEILVNIINYAYPGGNGTVELRFHYERVPKKMCFDISDSGRPYNPLKNKKEFDMETDLKDREIGGLGIFLYTKIMDTVSYEYKNNKNCLHICKKLPD